MDKTKQRTNTMNKQKLLSILKQVIKEHEEKYEFLGKGGQRIVFLKNKSTVIKVPLSFDGMLANESEARLYKKYKKNGEIPYAKCKLITHAEGVSLLEMEWVDDRCIDKYPKWSEFVDCQQIGYDRNGKLVAFDYAA